MTGLSWPLRREYRSPGMEVRGHRFNWGERTYVMGIINVTPDSFSGDGLAANIPAAVALARRFEGEGASILDVGGESTRPGAEPLGADAERQRVVPAIAAIRAATGLPISIDTCHAAVAREALEAGADIINDIWGLRFDPEMAAVAARSGAPVIAMHNQRGREHRDVAGDIAAGFDASLAAAAAAGVEPARIILDPGFGFGWTAAQNLEMVRRLPELWAQGLPLLMGPSRKSAIGLVLDAPVEERLEGTAATVAVAIAAGVDIIRVHDVQAMARVARMTDALVRGNWQQ